MATLKDTLARYRREVEEEMRSVLAGRDLPLYAMMRYHLGWEDARGGPTQVDAGKRLRPIFCLLSCEAVGGRRAVALPAAAALELVHNFSLVHDDLPCMDNDDERRGHPTTHKKFGEALGLLAGDALLILAFQALAACGNTAAVRELAVASGCEGMTGGQAMELENPGVPPDEERLIEIHRRKTGDLIRASVRLGAILAGAPAERLSALTAYAENIGLTFQIVDDLLDSEEEHEKAAFPAVFGAGRARKMAEECTRQAVSSLASFGPEADRLRELAFHLLKRGS